MPFIVLEGLDGAGKSTQVSKITNVLSERGIEYEFIHFPRYDAPYYGELISKFLRGEFGSVDKVDPYLVATLYAEDRADAAPMIQGWIDDNKVVITDRFVYSNIAFQCAKIDDAEERNRLMEWIYSFEFEHNALPKPDISLFLDVPFEFTKKSLSEGREGSDRNYLDGEVDIHEESLELQIRVREMYLACAERDSMLQVVDCSDERGDIDRPENIFERVIQLIKPHIEEI